MLGTIHQLTHHRIYDGERCLIWATGIGEVLIPVGSRDYVQAMGDRGWQHNGLVNEGEDDILNVYFRATTAPTTFYGRLYTAVPVETSTLATISGTEQSVAAVGYPGSVSWTRGTSDFGAPADASGSQTTTSVTKTWTASGTWTASLTHLVLATAQTGTAGKLISWSALNAARSLVNLDTLDVSVAIGLN